MKSSSDLLVINQIYKPYKYTIKGKVKILYTTNGDVVIKPKTDDKILSTYNYLKSRNFENFVPLIDSNREGYNVFPCIYENKIPYEQKGKDLINTVALLHTKTSFNKNIDSSVYDNIYNDVLNNIEYLLSFYSNLYDEIFLKEFYTPFENLFIDKYSKINNALLFSKRELDIWYSLVSDNKSQRVSLIHNNLKIDHFLKGEQDYLISFEKSKIDTPILDLIKFYKNEYNKLDFSNLLKNYLYHSSLNDDELKLFFIIISIPDEIKIVKDHFQNVKSIYKVVDYINKTEELIRPYYSKENEEE